MFSRLLKRAIPAATSEPLRQIGAIPYRIVEGQPVFLLVTSRRTGRWIFPKGAVVDGLTPAESAAQEALEEAGVEGVVWSEPVGSYETVKMLGIQRRRVIVEAFPLEVTTQHEDWQEKAQRRRHWAIWSETRRLLSEPGLVDVTKILLEKLRLDAQNAATTLNSR
ncbi:MAG: NUDIX hydrolase [Salinarimonadaceae bacterium]|nr:MAG: NUDIX hydrolase [Salinarimonadaceae bacterium]